MLPSVIPNARILTYDYDARTQSEAPIDTLLGYATNMLELVWQRRREVRTEMFRLERW
jgi:hypothetical protein